MKDDTRWWMLQVQFQERHPGQLNLLSEPLPRDELFRECLRLIPANIRVPKKNQTWGLANLTEVGTEVFSATLMVKPPYAHIAEEPEPGVLEETQEPRYFTPIVAHIPLQIITVHRASEVARFARSAKSTAAIFYDLLEEAMSRLKMIEFYKLEVEPIAKTGSFVQWFNTLDQLNRISIHYVGPNLPSRPGNLVESIKETAKSLKKSLKSETVDLIANEPHLDDEDVEEIDKAVAERRLRLRAHGNRAGIGTSWSSSTRPEAEIVRMTLAEEELSNPLIISGKIKKYLENYFTGEDR